MAEPSREELLARIAELERETAKKKSAGALSFKVSDKGAVSVYGLGAAEEPHTFLEENKSDLKLKVLER